MIELTHGQQETLLGRRVRPLLTPADRQTFAGQRCLITGAGGSVGSELARQLAECGVGRLTLVDQSEHNLFQIERELVERYPSAPVEPVLADVTRLSAMRHTFRRVRPHVVFHAAAYKHVGMAERAICAAARVNVIGTRTLLEQARDAGARFVLISSDKAASPRSVMGATKRMAELVTRAAWTPAFRTAVVRFGNILASSGSFVEIALERIRTGRSIPVTNPDATRYFMTVSEAVSLVMKVDALAKGGETFWLDMGKPLRIGDLAERMRQIAAQEGWPPAPVAIIGLRAGEKLNEQLTTQGVDMRPTVHPRIWVARQRSPIADQLEAALVVLRKGVARDDALGTLKAMTAAVPDFEPSAEAWATARAEQLYVPLALPQQVA